MSSRVLVTGAAGFIGSHVVEALLNRGDNVVGIDNLNDYYSPSQKKINLTAIRRSGGSERFEWVEGDIRNASFIEQLFTAQVFDAVVHLAAMPGVRASIERPGLYYDINLNGTLALLTVCAAVDTPPNFVFASTSSVYGRTTTVPFVESDPCDRPLVPYSASKRAAEMLCYTFHDLHGVDVTVLRLFTVYGPRNRPDMMAFKLVDAIRRGEEVPVYGDGKMYRDWTFVTDVCDGIVAAADVRLGYEVINIGRGEPILLSDFIGISEELTGTPARLVPTEVPQGDVLRTFADITKAKDFLGYSPVFSVRDGVARLVEWYDREAVRSGA